jgi:hypothetical protein
VVSSVRKEDNGLFWFTDEFPGHVETVEWSPTPLQDEPDLGSKPLEDNDVTIIEKSNLLLLGPSGVGKTYSMYSIMGVFVQFPIPYCLPLLSPSILPSQDPIS